MNPPPAEQAAGLDGSNGNGIEVTIDKNVSTGTDGGGSNSNSSPLCDRRIIIAVVSLVVVGIAGGIAVALTKPSGTSNTADPATAAPGGGVMSIMGATDDDFWQSGGMADESLEEPQQQPLPTRRPSSSPRQSDGAAEAKPPTKQSVLDFLFQLNSEANEEAQQQQQTQKITLDNPNILFLPVDDLNTWLSYTGKNPQSKTPNFDRLAAMGLAFTNAHAASTICNPSRAATWSGIRPSTSGCYDNKDEPWTRFIAEGLNLNAHFKDNGWYAAARGKTYHSSKSGLHKADEKKTVYPSEWHEYPKSEKKPDPVPNHLAGFTQPFENARNYKDDHDPDWHTASYCIDQIRKFEERDGPTFLACGLIKPHLPFAVPQKYYDMYPTWEIELPPSPEDDLDDVPTMGWDMARPDKEDKNVTRLGRRRDAVQGYLASIRYADMNLGRILDAYEALPQSERDNTIVALFSDHGFHLGEKRHYKKGTLWEEASEVPFIWVVPGVTSPGSVCRRAVDLMSIYPTLCDLAGLDVPSHVEGANIRRLLENPDATWDGKAVSTMGYENHAVIDERYRYIRYQDGSEELYDHSKDPYEHTNRADWGGRYNTIKEELSAWLPKNGMRKWEKDQTCTDSYYADNDAFVKRCEDGSFVGRDPSDSCNFVDCHER